jgi:hypothetical protein
MRDGARLPRSFRVDLCFHRLSVSGGAVGEGRGLRPRPLCPVPTDLADRPTGEARPRPEMNGSPRTRWSTRSASGEGPAARPCGAGVRGSPVHFGWISPEAWMVRPVPPRRAAGTEVCLLALVSQSEARLARKETALPRRLSLPPISREAWGVLSAEWAVRRGPTARAAIGPAGQLGRAVAQSLEDGPTRRWLRRCRGSGRWR